MTYVTMVVIIAMDTVLIMILIMMITMITMGPICARPPDPEAIWAHGPANKLNVKCADAETNMAFQSKALNFFFALRV